MMPYERELAAAREAAHLAGTVILDAYAHFRAIPNARADISTEADRQSQETILQYLHRLFPRDVLCAEEPTPTLAQSGVGPRTWVVDPIDGTRGFAKKNGEFSVMVGLIDGGQPVVGVVFEPILGRCTYAVRGAGCHAQQGDASPVGCHVSPTADLAACVLAQSHSKDLNTPSRAVAALHPTRVVETYSAGIKLALVARGEADLYVNDYPTFHDWDVCAGHILVEEAGGRVTGLKGEALVYGRPGAAQHIGLLASNGRLHSQAVERWISKSKEK
jgi:3'(2'), 5'-bisphosphate nucleotidase